jgi:hypothetical protein
MAETLISPGVLALENDNSFITQQPVTVGAAIIGPTVKGPVEVPTIVTSYSDYQNKFGTTFLSGSQVYTYFTSIAAYNYFNNGGETLLVARVTTGSFTSAFTSASSATPSPNGCGILNSASLYAGTAASQSLVLSTISEGVLMNSSCSIDSSGSLSLSGSTDNIRWQIANSDTSAGTFSLLIRQGNDNTNTPIVLETWTNLSMDPTAPNYVARVIGNQYRQYSAADNQVEVIGDYPTNSRYVYVSAVNTPTPNYFDNNGNPQSYYTGSIPANASGSFVGATGTLFVATNGGAKYYNNIITGVNNIQGLSTASYTYMINLLANQDDYRFNVLLTPGLFASEANLGASQVTTIINNTQNRGDNIFVSDLVPYNSTINIVTGAANSKNTSYAASYWPWVQTIDPDSAQLVWVPASTMVGGVYAYNDRVGAPWFAPAGFTRGGLSVIQAERKLAPSDRDTLYAGKVNSLATFPGQGVVAYGQKTLQKKASALDRINVRRLLIELKSYIGQVANGLVFEQNTAATRNRFLRQVNPYLDSIQQRQGLYAYKVVMDDSNNTADVIDRNQLLGQIFIQPTRTAEFIILDFNVTPTGATFA